ncbi:hypothetical protein ASPZODRAFT_25901 [Penicilliopsis zonata CBS 506.65]|uniref:Rhodopsin domain-containing protein n=1 Tax=Penicilliopsis zonata CBS 506.65 TaxID=1073090 RepID=A0A1L9SFR4_9EURO|nr:hypothetical protein ASPZODRAFT_25901 [Penicilliopsis zonata CBS 506.65]OJJ46001.1 hypothetical protein ASPZODRAFT_25901 [Penicilliopsis zonata CBS 506.65]
MISIAPGSHQSLQIGCYVIFSVAMVVVCLRLYVRQFLVRKLGVDDYLIIVASLCSIGIIVTVPYMFNLGIGRHMTELTEHQLLYGRKWAWVSQILYYLALGLAKTSMVALYMRLASDPMHIRFLWVFGAIVFCHGIAVTIVTIDICTPISIMWSPSFPEGCIDILDFNYFNAAFHIFTDIMLAIIPIPILRNLQMNKRRKIGLMIVFAVGLLTIATTVARQVTNAISLLRPDFPWYWSAAELCTCLEVNMGLICTSVPALRSLFKVYFGGSSNNNNNNKKNNQGDESYELNRKQTSSGRNDFNRFERGKKQVRTHFFGRASRLTSTSNESQDDIIPGETDGVVQTTDFLISYEGGGTTHK